MIVLSHRFRSIPFPATPSELGAYFGPKAFNLSIPKSGTHLLTTVLGMFPGVVSRRDNKWWAGLTGTKFLACIRGNTLRLTSRIATKQAATSTDSGPENFSSTVTCEM